MTRARDVSKGATRNEFIYTATTQQTTFSGNDDSSNSLSYTVGQIDVFVNGVRQAPADYTATNGTSVVLGAGASAGDTVQINAFGTFSVSDVIVARAEFDYTATAGQTTFTGNDNDSQSMSYTAGRIDVYLNGSRLNVTDDYVATNGTSVVLQSGAQAGDSLVVVSHGTVNLVSNILDTTLDLNGEKLVLDADADTSIHASTDDQIDIEIAGADDFKFTANTFSALDGSSVLIGGGSSRTVGGVTAALQVEGTAINDSSISMISNGASGTDGLPAKLVFGRTGAASLASNTVVADGNEIGVISFQAADGTDVESQAASIFVAIDGTPGGNDTPGRMMFATCADGSAGATERMRIHQNGVISMGTTDKIGKLSVSSSYNDGPFGRSVITARDDDPTVDANNQIMVLTFSADSDASNGSFISFRDSDGEIGHVSANNASSVTFGTTSDYRLKENVDYSWTATTRLKQLKPCRFNFIADSTNTLQDGFLAHEVSSVVPEAVQGDKDATRTANNVVKNANGTLHVENVTEAEWTQGKSDGLYASDTTWASSMTTPVRQMIDHSKLVPLLTKTIQELEARITALES